MSQQPHVRGPGLGPARQVVTSVAVSGFGTWSYNVGIAVYAYDRTHSAAWVAVVTVGRYLPALLLGWLARSVVDRLPRRSVALAGDVGCAGVMAVLAMVGFLDAPLWLVTVVAAVSSTLARIQAAAVLALAADVVVESELARAARLAGAAEAVATAAGSAAASAVLVHWSPPTLFVVNAVTFLLSAVLLSTVPATSVRPRRGAPHVDADQDEQRPWRRRDRVRETQAFWPLQASRGLAAYIYGVDIVVLTIIAGRQLHSAAGTGAYGWLLAATGVGGLVAVTVMRHHVSRTPPATLLLAGIVVYALPLVVFTAAPPIAAALLTQAVRGAGSVLVTSAALTGLQRAVPSSMSGRVFSATQSLVLVGTSAGALTTPLLFDLAGLTATLVVCALLPALAALALFPFLVRFDRDEELLLAELDPRLSVLRNLQLLRDASRSTLYELADAIDELDVSAGTALVRQGEAADAFYVLVAGRVEVTVWSPDGPALLRHLVAPNYFGEIGLLHAVPRSSTVTATGPCTIWRIPAAVFLAGVAEAGVSGALSDTVQVRFSARPQSLPVDELPPCGP